MAVASIQSSGGDYATLQDWENNLSANPSSAETAQFDESFDGGAVTINVSNTSNVDITVTAASGYRANENAEDSCARVNTSSGTTVQIATNDVTIEHVQLKNTSTGGDITLFIIHDGRHGHTIRFNRLISDIGGSGGVCGYERDSTGSTSVASTWHNNRIIVRDVGQAGLYFRQLDATNEVGHNSIVVSDSGSGAHCVLSRANTVNCENNATFNAGSGSCFATTAGGSFTGDYNLADDTTGPGANAFDSVTGFFVSVTLDSEDLDMDSSNDGTYEGADVTSTFGTVDFYGTTRADMDVGAHEYVSPALTGAVTEALSMGETFSAVVDYAAAVTEAVSLNDSAAGATSLLAAIAEALALDDAAARSKTVYGAVTEALNLDDAETVVAALAASLTETLNLDDPVAAVAALVAAFTEALNLDDTASSGQALTATIAEGLALTDASTVAAALTASIAEALSADDTPAAVAALQASATEALNLDDVKSVALAAVAAVTEALDLDDSPAGTIGGGTPHTGAVTEALDLDDSPAAMLAAQAGVAEALGMGDVAAAALDALAALTEGVALDDTPAATLDMQAAAPSEDLALGDTMAGSAGRPGAVTEDAALDDVVSAEVGLGGRVTEDAALDDSASAVLDAAASPSEGVALGEDFDAQMAWLPTLSEGGVLSDSYSAVVSAAAVRNRILNDLLVTIGMIQRVGEARPDHDNSSWPEVTTAGAYAGVVTRRYKVTVTTGGGSGTAEVSVVDDTPATTIARWAAGQSADSSSSGNVVTDDAPIALGTLGPTIAFDTHGETLDVGDVWYVWVGPFATSLDAVLREGDGFEPTGAWVEIRFPREFYSDTSLGRYDRQMLVDVVAYSRRSETPEDDIEALIADIKRAVMQDRKRNGYAIDTNVVEVEGYALSENSHRSNARVQVWVHWRDGDNRGSAGRWSLSPDTGDSIRAQILDNLYDALRSVQAIGSAQPGLDNVGFPVVTTSGAYSGAAVRLYRVTVSLGGASGVAEVTVTDETPASIQAQWPAGTSVDDGPADEVVTSLAPFNVGALGVQASIEFSTLAAGDTWDVWVGTSEVSLDVVRRDIDARENAPTWAILHTPSEQRSDRGPLAKMNMEMTCPIVVRVRADEDMAQAVEEYMRAIHNAILLDRTRGGLALDTDLDTSTGRVLRQTNTWGFLSVPVLIAYRTADDDPRSL